MTPQQNDSPNPIAQFGVPAPLAASNTTSSASTDGNNPIADLGVPAKLASEISTTPDFNAHDLVAGPGTALATPESPEWKQEGSGVSDILHGNIGQGASKIWDAERPHVIQGSLLEKAMQKIDPDFHGSVTPEQVQAHNAAYNAGQRPLVDAGQFVDKNQHPITKAIAEATSNLTSPESIATLYASGGLGLVNNPAALGFAKRLMSGGFSAVAIANAYKNYQGFREAVDNKNWPEAEYQITHAVIGGTLGLLAARGAATDTPLADAAMLKNVVTKINPFRKAAQIASDVSQGKAVNQEPAVAAVRTGTEASTTKAGTANPTLSAGIKSNPILVDNATVIDEPLKALAAKEKAAYGDIDSTVGFDLKAAKDDLKGKQYDIKQPQYDAAQRITKSQEIDALTAKIADAEKKLSDAGIDPKVADTLHTQRMAGTDFKNALVRATAPDGTINVDKLLTASKNLRFAKRGDRLGQFMGEDAADDFVNQLQDAQKAGVKAVGRQKFWGGIGKGVLKLVGLGVAGEVLKSTLE